MGRVCCGTRGLGGWEPHACTTGTLATVMLMRLRPPPDAAAVLGRVLKRSGVFVWKSRTRSASERNGLGPGSAAAACSEHHRREGACEAQGVRCASTKRCEERAQRSCGAATHLLLLLSFTTPHERRCCAAARSQAAGVQLKVVWKREGLGGAEWLGHLGLQHTAQLLQRSRRNARMHARCLVCCRTLSGASSSPGCTPCAWRLLRHRGTQRCAQA